MGNVRRVALSTTLTILFGLTIFPATRRFRFPPHVFPDCLGVLSGNWRLLQTRKVLGFLPITKSQRQRLREAHHLRHVLHRVRAGFPSHSLLFESAVMNVQQFRQFG